MAREIKTFENIRNKSSNLAEVNEEFDTEFAVSEKVHINSETDLSNIPSNIIPLIYPDRFPVKKKQEIANQATTHDAYLMDSSRKSGPFMDLLLKFDNYVWTKGQETDFLGIKDMKVLPSDDWTEGESNFYTANFIKNIGKTFKELFTSSDNNEKHNETTVSVEIDIPEKPVKISYRAEKNVYNDSEILPSDMVPTKFAPDFSENTNRK